MNKKLFVGAFALVAAAIALGASSCTVGSNPAIGGITFGTGWDENAKNITGATTSFSTTASLFHAKVAVTDVAEGTKVSALWQYQSTPVRDITTTDYTVPNAGSGDIHFSLSIPATGVWPLGAYKLIVTMTDANGNSLGTKEASFQVQ